MKKKHIFVGIINYPQAQLGAIHGLSDMLMTANHFIDKLAKSEMPSFCVTHWTLSRDEKELQATFCTQDSSPDQQDIVLIPGGLDTQASSPSAPSLLKWIKMQHEGGAIICSICKGAFILAQCGLLDNRTVTTHWDFADDLSTLFPDVQVQTDKILIDSGDLITAGGMMAWIDLGLRLIHRFIDSEVMLAAAKFLLVDTGQREQKYYSSFSPLLNHGDETVAKVQRYLQTQYGQPLSLEKLADVAAISIRTLIRRFHSALNMTPTSYIQQLRIGKARELLELTNLPVNKIAWKVGYEDPGAFRKLFQRALSLSPGEYRKRFAVKI